MWARGWNCRFLILDALNFDTGYVQEDDRDIPRRANIWRTRAESCHETALHEVEGACQFVFQSWISHRRHQGMQSTFVGICTMVTLLHYREIFYAARVLLYKFLRKLLFLAVAILVAWIPTGSLWYRHGVWLFVSVWIICVSKFLAWVHLRI